MAILGIGLFFIAVVFGCNWIFQQLWNIVIGDLFHGPYISFWMAFLVSFFFGMVGSWFKSDGKKS